MLCSERCDDFIKIRFCAFSGNFVFAAAARKFLKPNRCFTPQINSGVCDFCWFYHEHRDSTVFEKNRIWKENSGQFGAVAGHVNCE